MHIIHTLDAHHLLQIGIGNVAQLHSDLDTPTEKFDWSVVCH